MLQKSVAARVVLSTWLLAVLVLSYAYTGSLIARLTAPEFTFLVRNLNEIKAKPEILPYIVRESSTQEAIIVTKCKHFQNSVHINSCSYITR